MSNEPLKEHYHRSCWYILYIFTRTNNNDTTIAWVEIVVVVVSNSWRKIIIIILPTISVLTQINHGHLAFSSSEHSSFYFNSSMLKKCTHNR